MKKLMFSKKDNHYMQLAINLARERIGLTGSNPSVGCIIVKDNRIISQGYNGFLPGCPHKSFVRDNHEQATVHAEQKAVADCARRGVSCDGCTAYITHYPCIHCFKIMAASGIKEIKYINDYKNDKNVMKLSQLSDVRICKILL